MKEFDSLLEIAKRKRPLDKAGSWYDGPETYLKGIEREALEVCEELKNERLIHLEDELGDILWDYLNLVSSLEEERGVSVQRILQGACAKYEERVSGIERGQSWNDIKQRQAERLAGKQKEYDGRCG